MRNTFRLTLTCTALVISGALPGLPGAGAQEPVAPPVPSPELTRAPLPEPSLAPKPGKAPKPSQASSTELAVRAVSGMGMYVWRWERAGPVSTVVARAKEAGMSFLVVRASSQSQGLYLAPILDELLPKAHAAGLKVVAYDPPRFEDIEADVRRAYDLVAFRASGHGIDAFAADIEPRWELLTPENAGRYGSRLREVVGPRFPLVGIVYPPNQVGARFPFAAVAEHFDLLSPMSYWRARTLDGPGFVAASVEELRATGKPVSVIGQAFSYGAHRDAQLRGHPSRAEIESAITVAREQGAVGMSFWVWETAEEWVFDVIRAAGWRADGGPSLGTSPPPVPPVPPPVPQARVTPSTPVPAAAGPAPSPRAQALALPGPPLPAPGTPWGAGFAALVLLATAVVTVTREHPVPALVSLPARAIEAAERGAAPFLPTGSRSRSARSRPGRGGRSSPPAGPARRRARAGSGST